MGCVGSVIDLQMDGRLFYFPGRHRDWRCRGMEGCVQEVLRVGQLLLPAIRLFLTGISTIRTRTTIFHLSTNLDCLRCCTVHVLSNISWMFAGLHSLSLSSPTLSCDITQNLSQLCPTRQSTSESIIADIADNNSLHRTESLKPHIPRFDHAANACFVYGACPLVC